MQAADDKRPAMADSTGGADVFSDEEAMARRTRPASGAAPWTDERRQARIAEIAYGFAERRGFTPGLELEDWLEAERQVDDEIAAQFSRITSA